VYNSQIKNEDLAPSEQSKGYMYAVDANGKPYSPGWYTLNVKTSYKLNQNLTLTAGWENITNQRYRPYSSGIVAAGSNFIFSVRASL
jgi:hemoglobin/transferrin/lactoferrin receptor protein